ncbi:MAG: UDP-N-acetylmuramate dehydrogenase [Anaerolineaceae bacterium]|nr:MAG: UDP-N-acetylmuramate dehydrogenase [Anaerolineaceae bacterium]
MSTPIPTAKVEALRDTFESGLLENTPLAQYTAARIGGPADFLIIASSGDQLAEVINTLWDIDVPFRVLGAGSNILVSDQGVREVVVLNRAREVRFIEDDEGPKVEAESGAMLGVITRRSVERGLSGLEWAASIPGTIGGAVVGNAGAYGDDIAGMLEMVEILQRGIGVEQWPVQRLEYAYRDSWLKQHPGEAVVLKAVLGLKQSTPEECKAKMGAFVEQRKRTQPSGASMGSMFKNPEGDYAGRLIEAVGLKGTQQGAAQISPLHANFFINLGDAAAADVWDLIQLVRERVASQFDVWLELEVELVGDWEIMNSNVIHSLPGGQA